jgi:hypothetical protein
MKPYFVVPIVPIGGRPSRKRPRPRYDITIFRQLADVMSDGRRLTKILSARGVAFEVGSRSVDPSIAEGARTNGWLRVSDPGLLDRGNPQSWTMERFDGEY